MKQVQLFQTSIKVAALITLLLATAYKCAAQQPIRVQTEPGLIEITESADPDEICIRFGEKAGEVKVQYLQYSGKTVESRMAAAVQMANDAGEQYAAFLRKNKVRDNRHIREYFDKCHDLRRQFLCVLTPAAFNEFSEQMKYF